MPFPFPAIVDLFLVFSFCIICSHVSVYKLESFGGDLLEPNLGFYSVTEDQVKALSRVSVFSPLLRLLKSVAAFAPETGTIRRKWDTFQEKLETAQKAIEGLREEMKKKV